MKFDSQNLFAAFMGVVAIAVVGLLALDLPALLGQTIEPSGSTIKQDKNRQENIASGINLLTQKISAEPAPNPPQKRMLVPINQFLSMLRSGMPGVEAVMGQVEKNWDISYLPMMLEAGRFLPPREQAVVLRKLETKTGLNYGGDFDKWMQWMWKQEFEPHPDYAQFKAILYSKIDPRFTEYFVQTENATIRLDEVRWGGVRRDGIPPLKNPRMLMARDAHYLADTDVVFGIELNGDARCYPKRILAWHEMFKDTIGGESVCGVY